VVPRHYEHPFYGRYLQKADDQHTPETASHGGHHLCDEPPVAENCTLQESERTRVLVPAAATHCARGAAAVLKLSQVLHIRTQTAVRKGEELLWNHTEGSVEDAVNEEQSRSAFCTSPCCCPTLPPTTGRQPKRRTTTTA
jgi:hypothetical protein